MVGSARWILIGTAILVGYDTYVYDAELRTEYDKMLSQRSDETVAVMTEGRDVLEKAEALEGSHRGQNIDDIHQRLRHGQPARADLFARYLSGVLQIASYQDQSVDP